MATVRLGIDRVLKAPERFSELVSLPGIRIGPHAQPAKVGLVTSDGARPGVPGVGSARQGLLRAGIPLRALFSPEHGISGKTPDGAPVADGLDAETGLPVVSLYGPRLAPTAPELEGLDLLLFDLQDVGVRFYTFLWTLVHLMESCGEAGVPLRILDRPNPLGGDPTQVEGPIMEADIDASFLGRWPIPIRHSLTLGEMALLLRAEMELAVELDIVTMDGWRRSMTWPDTGLPYHPPSPGLPEFSSILLYPGLAFLEATNVHEGRGTKLAFQWFGAPWMDGAMGAKALNEAGIPGVRAHPHPLSCPGVRLEVTDPSSLRPVALGLRVLKLLSSLWPRDFQWGPYPTAANPSGEAHLTRLLGSAASARV